MAEDYEVLRKLWDGRIPILIFLDETEFPNRPVRPFCVSHFYFTVFSIFIVCRPQ